MHIIPNTRKVFVSREDVARFNAQWPGSKLRSARAYWFEFDKHQSLIDCDVPEQDDGPEALAMAADCEALLFEGNAPNWARVQS